MIDSNDLFDLGVKMMKAQAEQALNPEAVFSDHPVNQGRPFIDPEVTTHEGYSDDELAAMLELQAAVLDNKGLHGIAMDVRAGAERLRKLAEGK